MQCRGVGHHGIGPRIVSPANPRRRIRKAPPCAATSLGSNLSTQNLTQPVRQSVTVSAPATVANLGPGFDWLGCAVQGEGDIVTATVLPEREGSVVIEDITGDGGRLPRNAARNCVGIAASKVLELIGRPTCGVSLRLQKGLPLGSGLGSSAASAAAGAWAVNALFGEPLTRPELVPAGLAAEASVSGFHADNIAPALCGGFVLIRSCAPLDLEFITPFPLGKPIWFVLVSPDFEAPTAEMRAALPLDVPLESAIHNGSMGASLIAGILTSNPALMGLALDSDNIIEPVRGKLIPGFFAVKAAAQTAGAYGCTISGAGPTCIAIVDDPLVGRQVAEAMAQAFEQQGNLSINFARVVQLDTLGAQTLSYT